MGAIDVPGERRRAMKLGFPPAPRAGRIVMELSGVGFSYGDKRVYDDLNLAIERGRRVALVGPNGAGKTTLLKLIAGALEPQAGERRPGHNVSLGYFAQHQIEALDPENRVIEELERAVPPGVQIRARDLLGRFLFSGDDVDKKVAVLSGGERTRLAMAKILVSARNLLCLDEPTNHLDIWSRDALEDALEDYDGALVLITHDRHLIRQVADTIVEVIDGRVRVFPEEYESYLERRAAEEAATAAPAARTGAARTTAAAAAKERRRASADERARARAEMNARRSVEREIERLYAELEEMNGAMSRPDFYSTTEDIAGFMKTYDDARARVADLEAEWDKLTS